MQGRRDILSTYFGLVNGYAISLQFRDRLNTSRDTYTESFNHHTASMKRDTDKIEILIANNPWLIQVIHILDAS